MSKTIKNFSGNTARHASLKRICQVLCLAVFLSLSLGLAGCGSKQPIDWESRVGVYTLEQAKDDYGDPQGFQELADGNRLYLWYDQGRQGWYDVVGLVFDQQGRLVKMERNERD